MELYVYNINTNFLIATIKGRDNTDCENTFNDFFDSNDDIGSTYSPAFGFVDGLINNNSAHIFKTLTLAEKEFNNRDYIEILGGVYIEKGKSILKDHPQEATEEREAINPDLVYIHDDAGNLSVFDGGHATFKQAYDAIISAVL